MHLIKTSGYPIGIDISDLSLKLFQLNKQGEKISIQAISKYELPKGIIDDGEIINKPELLKAVNTLLTKTKHGKVSSTEVIACLPESKTFIKLIEVENSPNDLSLVLKSEIEKYIPLSVDEIYFDWQVVKTLPTKKLILIGAAPKNIVDQYSNFFDEAGLSVVALEIESIAICRCLLEEESYRYKGQSTGNYAIIDMGAKRTSMVAYSQNTILFTVSMPISGDEITENISKTLRIDREQAEKAKIICGLSADKAKGVIKNILSEMIDDLIKRVQETIKYHAVHFSEFPPLDKIYLCGGGSNIENIDKIIQEAIKIEVKLADPLINLQENGVNFNETFSEAHQADLNFLKNQRELNNLSITKNYSLAFTTAIGLALRGVFIDEI